MGGAEESALFKIRLVYKGCSQPIFSISTTDGAGKGGGRARRCGGRDVTSLSRRNVVSFRLNSDSEWALIVCTLAVIILVIRAPLFTGAPTKMVSVLSLLSVTLLSLVSFYPNMDILTP